MQFPIHEKFLLWRTRLRIAKIASLFLVMSIAYASLVFLTSIWRETNVWIWGEIGIFVISVVWGMIFVSVDYTLAWLVKKDKNFSEQIKTALELEQISELGTSRETQYFRKRTFENALNLLEKSHPHHFIPIKTPLLVSIIILLSMMTWSVAWEPLVAVNNSKQNEAESLLISENHSFRILYPAYTGEKSKNFKQFPQSLNIPEGSRIEIYWNEGKLPKKNSIFRTQNNQQEELTWQSVQSRWVAVFSPQESGKLELRWNQSVHHLQVIADKPPSVSLEFEAQPHIFENSRLQLKIKTNDDYGLRTIALKYMINETLYSELIQTFEGDFRSYDEWFPWELGSTAIQPKDVIRFWIEVTDTNTLDTAQISKSQEFEIIIESLHEYHQEILQRFWKLSGQITTLLSQLDRKIASTTWEVEQKIIQDLQLLQQDMMYDSLLTEELKKFPNELQTQIELYQFKRRELGLL